MSVPAGATPMQSIASYHQDEDGDWVAELECGHFQHVRHNPPLVSREWVLSAGGRAGMVGFRLRCVRCAEGDPPDDIRRVVNEPRVR